MKPVLLIAAAAAVLGACAYPPYGYAPASPFTETRISSDRARITYRGQPGEDPWRVSDQTLLRAASLATQDGFTWFTVDQRYSDQLGGGGRGNGPFVSIGGGSTDWGRWSSSSIGGSIGFNLGGLSRPVFVETIEVRFGRGLKPEGAYDAADLQRTVGQRMPY